MKYGRILVPLDGSKLAECVLDHVETVAPACGTQEVVLVSVTEKVKVVENGRDTGAGWRMAEMTGVGQVLPETVGSTARSQVTSIIGRKYSQAGRYLDRIAKRLEKKGLTVSTEVLIGDPAEQITAYSRKNFDLILMASHGKKCSSR